MSNNLPDWNRIAEKFDLWLPYLAPVTEVLIKALDPGYGESILDVACGTGEPVLTLARRVGDADIIAVDAAPGMVNTAKAKAKKEMLEHIHFRVMAAEKLDFPAHHFDAVTCRFGVMLFDDPQAGLGEIQRVLKPGGRFALAVWGELSQLSSFKLSADVINPFLPEDKRTSMDKVTALGAPGVLETALGAAGFSNFQVERHTLIYTFPDFDSWWKLLDDSAIMAAQLDALSASQVTQIKDEMAARSHAYEAGEKLQMPHTYLIAHGAA